MPKKIISPLLNNRLYGHDQQVQEVRQAHITQRLHHAWLIHGPHSSGKATFACQLAKWLLQNEASEYIAESTFPYQVKHPSVAKMEVLSHPDFMLLDSERDLWDLGKKHPAIAVDEVRKAIAFSHMTPVEAQYRVVIVDSVDEMNNNASNAILKLLEEPPENMILLLVSHVIGKVLPTIRSRCRTLRLLGLKYVDFAALITSQYGPLPEVQLAQLYDLTGGAVRSALEVLELGITDLLADISVTILDNNVTRLRELASIMKKHPENWRTIAVLLEHMLRYQIRKAVSEGKDVRAGLTRLDNLRATLTNISKLHLDAEAALISCFAI